MEGQVHAGAHTPPTPEETAEFGALLEQLDPSELPAIAAMMRRVLEKTQ